MLNAMFLPELSLILHSESADGLLPACTSQGREIQQLTLRMWQHNRSAGSLYGEAIEIWQQAHHVNQVNSFFMLSVYISMQGFTNP